MTDQGFGYEQLNLEISGSETSEPLFLLHGWGSSAYLMRPIADAFAGEYRIYNLDLPGHGSSPPPPEPWGVPEHAELVFRLIRERIGQPVTIIGHSNGGRISLYMASDEQMAPWIKRLVLVSPSGITPRRGWKYYARKYTASTLKAPFQILPEPLKDYGLDWLRHSLVWRMLGSSDYKRLAGVMRETFVRTVTFHVDDRIQRIQAPTLILWGDRDEAVSRYQVDTLASRISDAGLVELKGAGHYGYLDDFDTFEAATRHFLTAGVDAITA
jgi:pimeloyl-ACP methyl ester carboxylesterase